MINDPITKVMQDASEIVRYDEVGIPLYIREGLLSSYPDHRALCHWHEDIEWVQIRSGQMNYYINGKRVLLNAGEAIIVNSRQMHYGYSENGQECDFICILCHPKILTANSVLYQSYITPVLSNPALEYLHLKPENPEDTEALQTLPEILRLKKEQPTAYEIEAAALLSLLWCRLLRTHPMMPDGNTAVSQDPDLLIQRDMVSYIYSHYSESINLEEIAAAGNGMYVRADNTNSALKALQKEIEKMNKTELDSKVYSEYDEQFQIFAWIALFLLIADFMTLDRKNRIFRKVKLFS